MRITARMIILWCLAAALASVSEFAASVRDSSLVEAVKNQNADAAAALIKQHADVNVAEGDGSTALHWAAHWDDLATADLLIRAGANVNAATDLGVTPLALACLNRGAAMAVRLLAAGADANAVTMMGETVLMTAARTGSLEVVNALLAHGANVNAQELSRGQTALMWAVAEQHADVVKLLIEHNADVNARTHVTDLLVNEGDADRGRNTKPVLEMIKKGGSTPLLFAARVGDLASAKYLVAAGANPNDIAPDGNSVLVLAAHSGQRAVAEFLLDKDANPNSAGAGYTALHAAVLRGDVDLVKVLLAHGADPNARLARGTPMFRNGNDYSFNENLTGATPFFLSAKYAEPGVMRVLASAGADTVSPIRDGTTPLMAAAGLGWNNAENRRGQPVADDTAFRDEASALAAVKLAVEFGADVNAVNEAGNAAIHAAIPKGFHTVIQYLVDHGAKLDIANQRGQTPLRLAQDERTAGVFGRDSLKSTEELLRQLGAKE
jgi:ankyrin repeat protein